MKKLKICVAAAAVSALLLSGCGMARDGFVRDNPEPTLAPVESPYITASPKPTEKPAEKGGADNESAGDTTGEKTTKSVSPSMNPDA